MTLDAQKGAGCNEVVFTHADGLRRSTGFLGGFPRRLGAAQSRLSSNLDGGGLGGDAEQGYEGENGDEGTHGLPIIPRAKRLGSHS